MRQRGRTGRVAPSSAYAVLTGSASGVPRPLDNTHLIWSCSRDRALWDPPTSSSLAEERTPPLAPPPHGGARSTDARSYTSPLTWLTLRGATGHFQRQPESHFELPRDRF